jgi:NACHT domain-containing protein
MTSQEDACLLRCSVLYAGNNMIDSSTQFDENEIESINIYCSCLTHDLGAWRGLGSFSNKNLKQIYVSHMLIDKSQKGKERLDSSVLESLLERPTDSTSVLIEGNAGSGKTMLLRNWSVTLAKSRLHSNLEGYVPIYLPLGWLERACGNGPWNKSLVEIAAQRYPDVIGRASEVLVMALSEAVQDNRAVILMDAVDEISKPALPHFLDWLKRVRASGARCPMVLTSRPRTHTDGVSVDNKMYVRAFNTRQRETFIGNWFGEHGQANISALRTHLQQSFRLQAPEVAGNPLFLTMMCVEFENSGKLSATPGKLLDQFVRLLLEAWDAQQGVQRASILLDLKLRVLESVAGYLFDLYRANIGERALFDHTRKFLNQIGSPIQASDVIEEIVNAGGLLVKDRGGDYQFCHDLFLEYFMARNKAFGLSENEQKRWVKEHILDSRYEKVIQFYQELKFKG